MEPHRILILSMEYSPDVSGGIGTHALELARGLAKRACEVTVVACSPGSSASYFDGNVAVHRVAPAEASSGPSSIVEGILAVNDRMIESATALFTHGDGVPELIQCYNWLTFRAAAELGRRLGVPVVSTIQYISHPVERWWGQEPLPGIVRQEQELFSASCHFIAVSASLRDLIVSTYRVPPERIAVVYNAMDPTPFSAPVSPEKLARLRHALSPDGSAVVLFAGRLSPQKGISALLDSAVLVLAQRPSVRYVLAGEPDSLEFARWIEDVPQRYPDLAGRIVFLGKTPRNKLPFIYKASDVAVVPSVYEPFGYAALEAMAAGTPVIVSATGGLAEIVEHERTGLHVPVRDSSDGRRQPDPYTLAQSQLRLLADRDFAAGLASAAMNSASENFHSDVMVQATRRVYSAAAYDFCALS